MFLIFLLRRSLGNVETVRSACAATIMCKEHTSSGDLNPQPVYVSAPWVLRPMGAVQFGQLPKMIEQGV
mgnify:CR=1 FL=1